MESEIKGNVQGTNNEGKETMTQINGLYQKEEINIQIEHNREARVQKNEERLGNLLDNLKRSNIQIIGVPEEKRKSKTLKTYLKKIMKENFPNLPKEIDFQEVQKTQRVPKKLDSRRNTLRHIIIKLQD